MDKFVTLTEQDKREAFVEAATRRGVLPIIIEKDFWVCWTLKHLLDIPEIAPHITFKGGTSLSKAYGIIDRFSEDIDLTISKTAPYTKDAKNPAEEKISGKEKQRRIDALKEGAQKFVSEAALPKLNKKFQEVFGGDAGWKVEIARDDNDKQTILFYYPKLLSYGRPYGTGLYGVGSYGGMGYIKPAIRLEFGARGDIEPREQKEITPYIAEEFPDLFDNPKCSVPTLAVERTFWEKATILHALYHGSKMRDRMSRHYYDTYILDVKGVTKAALDNLPLLDQVVHNKSVFFKDNNVSYETAKIGSLKLVPSKEMISELKADYKAMQEMFMTDAPDFDLVISTLRKLEDKINGFKH